MSIARPFAEPTQHYCLVACPANPGTYTNVDGQQIQRPTFSETRPAGASAQCRDGSYSFSANRRGTCSHHGGVATWY